MSSADWVAERRERGPDWKNDENRLKYRVLPELGDLPPAELHRHLGRASSTGLNDTLNSTPPSI